MVKIHAGNYSANLSALKKAGVLRANARILEIGSGTGPMVNKLENMGYQIQGIEPDRSRIELGTRHFGPLPIQEMVGDNLGFADDSFDLVLSFDVFEHIPDIDSHLREVKRVLAPGGRYLIGTPNKITNVPWEIATKRSLRYRTYHCSLHTRRQLRRRLQEHGFSTRFVDVPILNEFTEEKVKRSFGVFGMYLFRALNPDRLPPVLRTNMYVVARAPGWQQAD